MFRNEEKKRREVFHCVYACPWTGFFCIRADEVFDERNKKKETRVILNITLSKKRGFVLFFFTGSS